MNIAEIVKNTFEKDDGTCPYCTYKYTITGGKLTTLVGSFDDRYDSNHGWEECHCQACDATFTRESVGYAPYKENVWFTKSKVILKGAPSCFEDYVYKCLKCDGKVLRNYTNKDGSKATSLATYNVDGKWVKQYSTHFKCESCGHGGEVDEEYMIPKKVECCYIYPKQPYLSDKDYSDAMVFKVSQITDKYIDAKSTNECLIIEGMLTSDEIEEIKKIPTVITVLTK